MGDSLVQALIAAGAELSHDHGWSVREDGAHGAPREDDLFVVTLIKHLSPLFDATEFKRARIAALEAELATLRGAQP